jgi:Zn-dependent protease with chaperone function
LNLGLREIIQIVIDVSFSLVLLYLLWKYLHLSWIRMYGVFSYLRDLHRDSKWHPDANLLLKIESAGWKSTLTQLCGKLQIAIPVLESSPVFEDNARAGWIHGIPKIRVHYQLIQNSDSRLQRAVLAHELGHIVLKHRRWDAYLGVGGVLGMIVIVVAMLRQHSDMIAIYIAVVAFLGPIVLILLGVSRHREYRADQFACELVGDDAICWRGEAAKDLGGIAIWRARLGSILSTHPADCDRVQAMKRHLRTLQNRAKSRV